jgi:hypothetical protein
MVSTGANIVRASSLAFLVLGCVHCTYDWKVHDTNMSMNSVEAGANSADASMDSGPGHHEQHDTGTGPEPDTGTVEQKDGGPSVPEHDAGPDAGHMQTEQDAGPEHDAGPPPCPTGLLRCEAGGECLNLDNDLNHCGMCERSCASGQLCAGGECGIDCGAQTKCPGDLCADLNHDINHCGTCDKQCPHPAANGQPTCDGQCHIACDDTYRECSGQCYRPNDPAHCGASCKKCVAPANAKATCNGTDCGYQCLHATLGCTDGASTCGSWNFESGDALDWSLVSGGVAGQFGDSTARVFEGSHSLLIGVAPTADVRVPLCNAGKTTNVWIKTFSAQIYIDGPAIKDSSDNYLSLFVITGDGTEVVQHELQNLKANQWQKFTASFDASMPANTVASFLKLGFRFYDTGVTNFKAKIYIDDVRID